MKNFPTICIDNFFDNPDEIRDFALSLEYTPSKDGSYAGLRSTALHHTNVNMLTTTCKRLLSCFYDLRATPVTWEVTSYFYKIYPTAGTANTGWVETPTGNILDGIVYLNPTVSKPSGISTYQQTTAGFVPISSIKQEFLKGSTVDLDQYNIELENYNKNFAETASFSNTYNRLVAYDGSQFIKDNGFDCGEEFKLVQVFHIKRLVSQYMPLPRLREQVGKAFV